MQKLTSVSRVRRDRLSPVFVGTVVAREDWGQLPPEQVQGTGLLVSLT